MKSRKNNKAIHKKIKTKIQKTQKAKKGGANLSQLKQIVILYLRVFLDYMTGKQNLNISDENIVPYFNTYCKDRHFCELKMQESVLSTEELNDLNENLEKIEHSTGNSGDFIEEILRHLNLTHDFEDINYGQPREITDILFDINEKFMKKLYPNYWDESDSDGEYDSDVDVGVGVSNEDN